MNQRQIARNKIKEQAYKIYNSAIRSGELKRGVCDVCGTSDNIHGHHPNYNKPLDVIWLCAKHHRELHKRIGCNHGYYDSPIKIDTTKLITTKELTLLTGKTRASVSLWVQKGCPIENNRPRRYRWEDVKVWLDNRKIDGRNKPSKLPQHHI